MRSYRLLLRLFPHSFRNEYGGEMQAIFARRLRDASGPAALAALWIEAIAATAKDAALVHAGLTRQDARHALRALGRARGFTLTAVLVTALGIGATTAVFSVTDHVLLRPLPFPDPDRLVKVWQDQSRLGYSRMELSPGNYRDWKAGSHAAYASLSAFTGVSMNLTGGVQAERLEGTLVTVEFFRTLGVTARIGRTFVSADEHGPAPVVISAALWQRRFGANPEVVGRTMVLDQAPRVIVGVMPPGFHFPERSSEFWALLTFQPDDYEDRANRYLRAIARLAPGVSIERADAQLDAVAARLARAFPDANAETAASIVRLRDEVPAASRNTVAALAGAAAVLLLITCLNLMNLLLARAVQRDRELAVRAALGAGAERLVRQQLTESAIVALAGSMVGVGLAVVAVPLIARLVPTTLPVANVPALDGRLLAIAAIVTTVAAFGFGLMPALRASRPDLVRRAPRGRARWTRPRRRTPAVGTRRRRSRRVGRAARHGGPAAAGALARAARRSGVQGGGRPHAAHGAIDELSPLERFIASCARGDRAAADAILADQPGLGSTLRPEHHLMLHRPAESGNARVLETMLACGFDPEATDKDGVRPLHRAAMGGHVEAVRVLLRHGADVNAVDGMFSAAPLVWAVEGRSHTTQATADHVGVARLLIAAGSPLDWTPPAGAPGPERTLEGLIDLRRAAAERGPA